MSAASKLGVGGIIQKYFSGLKFRWLFALVALVFGVDLVIPDFIPFADEILLGLLTVLLGSWRKKKEVKKVGSRQADPKPSLSPPESTDQ